MYEIMRIMLIILIIFKQFEMNYCILIPNSSLFKYVLKIKYIHL